ncbi:MAG: hypothetical protein AAGN66_29510 [Acidobacteriota bacterium]
MKRFVPFTWLALLLALFAFAAMAGEAPAPEAEAPAEGVAVELGATDPFADLFGSEPFWKGQGPTANAGCHQEDCTTYGNCAERCDCKRLNCVEICLCNGMPAGCLLSCNAGFSSCVAGCFP